MDRRAVLSGGMAMAALACAPNGGAPVANAQAQDEFGARLKALEKASGGKLGAYILDTGSGAVLGNRSDELFCHCSTFKFSLAAFALSESDAGRLDLDEKLPIAPEDIIFHSPVVKAELDKAQAPLSLPIRQLAEAGQVISDNAAANVLMRRLGGPQAMTAFWRSIGDRVSRIDGYEPEINIIPPGTQENSTSPEAMGETLRKLVLGDVLSPRSRQMLIGWMEGTRTGTRRIQANLPQGWRALDKTGTGISKVAGNKTNDIAVLFPPAGRAPLIVSGYLETPYYDGIRPEDQAVLASLGALAVEWAQATV